MGQDKALMPFLGIPLIERLKDRLQILGYEIKIILLTALTISETPFVGLIAADMPFASPQLLTYLLERIQLSDADACLPSTQGGLEPLHAVYRRDTCLPLIRDAIQRDLWRMRSWHDQAKIEILDPVETFKITDSTYTFINLNTPEEFSAAEELAKKNKSV
jgi:molybdopterin-guanine dinucleotide biosynthesis protein A